MIPGPYRKVLRLSVLVTIALGAYAAFAAQNGSSEDPLLRALQQEMQRSRAQLKLEQVATPYYLDFRVFDVDEIEAQASFGGINFNVHNHFRFARVIVRVGDYRQDSFFDKGEGADTLVPLSDDIVAARHEIWLATDQAYKAAVEALSAKQAKLKQFTIDQSVEDFAHAEAVQHMGPLARLEVVPNPWIASLRQATSLYKTDPQVESCTAALLFRAVNRYFVTSEGTAIRDGQTYFYVHIDAATQASDGMRLERSKGYTVTALSQLPSQSEFQSKAGELISALKTMRDAPMVTEEYRGPVLFSARAAATVFANLVGENVLGQKPPLGQPARTVGAFATSYKSRVLPDIFSVVDDPTLATIAGQPLLGYYQYDDEGVKAEKVTVIDQGKLANYVIGRTPIRDFPVSNGHGRARIPWNPPGPSLGNLIITASTPLSADGLKKKLLDLCQQRDLPYCYHIDTADSHNTPNLLYRVWVKDGREELVRGAAFGDLDTRALRNDLVAAGDDLFAGNRLLNIPHSVVSPSILFDELEVKPDNKNRDKLPEYSPPPLTAAQ